MNDNDQGSSFRAVRSTSSIKLCDYTQNPHLQTWNDSTPVMDLKDERQSHVYLYSWEYLWDVMSHLTAVFLLWCLASMPYVRLKKLQSFFKPVNSTDMMCQLNHKQHLICVILIYFWKCHFNCATWQAEPPCNISAAGNVEKEDEDTLNISALPTASHRHRPHFKGMPQTPCGFR